MKFNLLTLACALMLAFGLSMGSFAGSITDADSDGVPDAFDNCTLAPNGPLGGNCSVQQDFDDDGYGTTCDFDFDNDGGVSLADLGAMLAALNGTDPEFDPDCDGGVSLADLGNFLAALNLAPGPSGLGCAAVIPIPDSCPPL